MMEDEKSPEEQPLQTSAYGATTSTTHRRRQQRRKERDYDGVDEEQGRDGDETNAVMITEDDDSSMEWWSKRSAVRLRATQESSPEEDDGDSPSSGLRSNQDGETKQQDSDAHVNVPVGSLLAQEMMKLNVEEREKALLDINAVSEPLKEDPGTIKGAVEKLRERLISQSKSTRTVYGEALAQNEEVAASEKFLIPFLRCECYDIEQAAARIDRYLNFKKDAYGLESLTKRIRMEDFDDETRACLESGCLQILALNDSAQRPIILCDLPRQVPFCHKSRLKVIIYLMDCLAEHEHNQRAGLVGIVVNCGPDHNVAPEASNITGTSKVMLLSPLRLESFHFVYDDPQYETIIKAIVTYHTESRDKVRIRIHPTGSLAQNRLGLSSVGIPVNVLPFDEQGDLLPDYHRRWLNQRRETEGRHTSSSSSSSSLSKRTNSSNRNSHASMAEQEDDEIQVVITEVQPSDILPGCTAASKTQPGNLYYQSVLSKNFSDYDGAAEKSQKTAIAKRVVDHMQSKGARFLKPFSKGDLERWTVMSYLEARTKVSMALRDRRKTAKAKQQTSSKGR